MSKYAAAAFIYSIIFAALVMNGVSMHTRRKKHASGEKTQTSHKYPTDHSYPTLAICCNILGA